MYLLANCHNWLNARTTFVTSVSIATLISLAACGSQDTNSPEDPMVGEVTAKNGLVMVPSQLDIVAAKAKLEGAIGGNVNLSTVANVNHDDNAASVSMTLPPTQVHLFGNPNLGTPLMKANQTVGIDLPQKMLFIQDASGATSVLYNHPDYLKQRHGLTGVDTQLDTIAGALSGLAEGSADRPVAPAGSDVQDIAANEGLVITKSANSVDDTINLLRTAIEDAGPLRLVTELDHAANAQSVDLELRPTKLLIFGNPMLGTPLMQAGQSIGIDLPQKFLVYENADGEVFIVHNDPRYLAKRHGLTGTDQELSTIETALKNLADGAAAQQ